MLFSIIALWKGIGRIINWRDSVALFGAMELFSKAGFQINKVEILRRRKKRKYNERECRNFELSFIY